MVTPNASHVTLPLQTTRTSHQVLRRASQAQLEAVVDIPYRSMMVTLDTLRALHEHDHKLAAYCSTCERWAVLDLERLIAEGRGDYCFIGR